MKRIVATLFALLPVSAAHAQSGLLPANVVWAGPPSGGQGFARARALVAADLPAVAPGSLALASGQIFVGQVSGFAGAVAMSGDCTIVVSGAITCTKTGGAVFGTLATLTPGTGVAAAVAVNVGSVGAVVVNGGALGTPSSGVLTNATGLPLAGVTGFGAGVSTALGTAVGSAGAPVVNGGALGTPSSGVGTNLTALNASNLSSGTVAAARGGAGAITGALKGSGAGVVTQAACADLSNGAASCSTDTTNAANITSGTVANARLTGSGAATVAGQSCTLGLTCGLSSLAASLGADVVLNNTANYFDGPSIAQGATGTWLASGTVTLVDTGSAGGFFCKLWDGTTVVASARSDSAVANAIAAIALSGLFTSPAANIRISCRDAVAVTGKILFNNTGNSKDSTITAVRIN